MSAPARTLRLISPLFLTASPIQGAEMLVYRCRDAQALIARLLLPRKRKQQLLEKWEYVADFAAALVLRWEVEEPPEELRRQRYYDYYVMLPALLAEYISYTAGQLKEHCPQGEVGMRWHDVWRIPQVGTIGDDIV